MAVEQLNSPLNQTKAPPSSTASLSLTARMHPWIQEFLADPRPAYDICRALGSPANVLFPELTSENLRAFQDSLNRHDLTARVYFAHKANRSDCLVRQLSSENSFIDVSSINELKHALGCGFRAGRIQATGPKTRDFLALSLMHNVTIAIDSISELSEILNLEPKLRISDRTPVLLRVCGFRNSQSQTLTKASRFGLPLSEIEQALKMMETAASKLHLMGFSFHLDTVSIPEKGRAIETCLELFDRAISRGFEPTVINIGGGFKVNYLAEADQWHRYITALKEATLGSRPPITWHGNTFGLKVDRGSLRGNFNSYSYYDPVTGPQFLEELLSFPLETFAGRAAGSILASNGIELWIEPGRALLDQSGITLASVNTIRRSSQGDILVGLNMKRQDVCFLDQEIFSDPVVLYQNRASLDSRLPEIPVYFAGNLCLESDLVCRHQTFLKAVPEPGDLVAFVNTAAYFMDFSASEAIMQPIARKAAVYRHNHDFAWVLDDQYQPWLSQSSKWSL